MADDRLPVVREMIMASSEDERRSALDRLLPHQQSDFEGIFEAMAGLPVTIRLLDPPLHEFLPPPEEATDARMRARIRALHESNPMLGTRGCRLGLMFPEIYEMQVRAIIRAAIAVRDRTGRPAPRRDHAPARRLRGGAAAAPRAHDRDGRRGGRRRVPGRDDDRAPASLHPRRRDRRARRLLLVRDERPHADRARVLARRRGGQVPDALPPGRRPRAEPVRDARPARGGGPDGDRGRARPFDEAGHQARDLRGARRRAVVSRLLPHARARLRVVLALPRPVGAPGCGAGGTRPRRASRLSRSAASSREPGEPARRAASGTGSSRTPRTGRTRRRSCSPFRLGRSRRGHRAAGLRR